MKWRSARPEQPIYRGNVNMSYAVEESSQSQSRILNSSKDHQNLSNSIGMDGTGRGPRDTGAISILDQSSFFEAVNRSAIQGSPRIPQSRPDNRMLNSHILDESELSISSSHSSYETKHLVEKKADKSMANSQNTSMTGRPAILPKNISVVDNLPLCINLTDMPYKLTLMIGHPLMDAIDHDFRPPEGVHFVESYPGPNSKWTPDSDKKVPKESEYLVCSIQSYKANKEDPTKKSLSQVTCVYEIVNNKSNGGPVFNFGNPNLTKPSRIPRSATSRF